MVPHLSLLLLLLLLLLPPVELTALARNGSNKLHTHIHSLSLSITVGSVLIACTKYIVFQGLEAKYTQDTNA